MRTPVRIFSVMLSAGILAAALSSISAQTVVTKSPTAADWAAMSKLTDFSGVWERGGGGAAPRGNAPAAGAPAASATAPRGGAAAPPRGNAGAAPAAAARGGARG